VAARKSFNAALKEYKKSPAWGSEDRAHLQRWIDDDRAEQVWDEIQCAVRNNNLWLPPKTFIRDILAARPVAITIGHRGKLRKCYRNAADEMERVAKFLRRPHPYGMPGYPQSTKLARMLDEAASYFRTIVEPSRNVPGVSKLGPVSTAHDLHQHGEQRFEGNNRTLAR
jgi:hypothetical protein